MLQDLKSSCMHKRLLFRDIEKVGFLMSQYAILNCTMEKEMATHSNILAWRIPWTGEPGGLLSMGSHRVRQD